MYLTNENKLLGLIPDGPVGQLRGELVPVRGLPH